MKIVADEVARLGAGHQATFERGLAQALTQSLGMAAADAAGRVHRGVELARAHQLVSRRAIASFVAVSAVLGDPFDQPGPLLETLGNSALGPPDARMAIVLDESYATVRDGAARSDGALALLRRAAREGIAPLDELVVPGLALTGLGPAMGDRAMPALQDSDAPGAHFVVPVGQGDVVMEAEVRPHPSAASRALTWHGGEPVEGAPHQRRLSRARPGHHHLAVTLDRRTCVAEVWVVAASVVLELAEASSSPGAFGTARVVATVEPSSVLRFVRQGWRFTRHVDARATREGAPVFRPGSSLRGGRWRDESPSGTMLPVGEGSFGDTLVHAIDTSRRSATLAANYRQWLAWQGEAISNVVEWRVRARHTRGADPAIHAVEMAAALFDPRELDES